MMTTQPQTTLVLDQSYRPVDIVHWTEAVTMWVSNKCEIVEEYEHDVRSTYLVIKMPAVIRLLKRFRRDKKPVRFSRVNIYARDGFRCQYCGKKCKMGELTYDHVTPRSKGGRTEWTNIVSACMGCNSWKGGRTPAQAGMKLLKVPVQPTETPACLVRISRETAPKPWQDYLYWTGELESDA